MKKLLLCLLVVLLSICVLCACNDTGGDPIDGGTTDDGTTDDGTTDDGTTDDGTTDDGTTDDGTTDDGTTDDGTTDDGTTDDGTTDDGTTDDGTTDDGTADDGTTDIVTPASRQFLLCDDLGVCLYVSQDEKGNVLSLETSESVLSSFFSWRDESLYNSMRFVYDADGNPIAIECWESIHGLVQKTSTYTLVSVPAGEGKLELVDKNGEKSIDNYVLCDENGKITEMQLRGLLDIAANLLFDDLGRATCVKTNHGGHYSEWHYTYTDNFCSIALQKWDGLEKKSYDLYTIFYDEAGRFVSARRSSDGDSLEEEYVSWTYDENGKCTSCKLRFNEGSERIEQVFFFQYDENGMYLGFVGTESGAKGEYSCIYTYDANGKVSSYKEREFYDEFDSIERIYTYEYASTGVLLKCKYEWIRYNKDGIVSNGYEEYLYDIEGNALVNVRFDVAGGTVCEPIVVRTGNISENLPVPTKEGFVFLGWYLDEKYNSPFDGFVWPDGKPLTLYAKWEKGVTITFVTGNGSAVAPIIQAAGTPVLAPVDPTLSVSLFDGWYSDKSCTTPYVFDVMPYEDITLYAKWKTKFTVVFKYIDKNGNEMFTDDYDPVSSNTVPNRSWGATVSNPLTGDPQAFADYVIVGWLADKQAAMAATEETEGLSECLESIRSDLTVYSVVREKKNVTVTLMNGDVKFDTLTLKEGDSLTETKRPTALGKYFKNWAVVEDPNAEFQSTEDCIWADCTFQAVFGATDGTIGKVAAGSITVDGVKDAAYANGAYLAHNDVKTSTNAYTINEVDNRGNPGIYAVPDIKADTYMLWDGDYVYLLIEVYDKTFTFRSESYIASGADAWLNDSIELWYTFEQDMGIKESKTRIGLAATGDVDANGNGIIDEYEKGNAKYALPRYSYRGMTTGIFGGRSTHFDEIEYGVRNAYFDTGADLDLDANGKPSYIVELKIPAWTEGEADMDYAFKDWDGAKQEPLTGQDLVDFQKTALKWGCTPNNDVKNYAYTTGKKLEAGDFIRLCLTINDLRISWEDLANTQKYLDSPDVEDVWRYWGIRISWSELNAATMLYELVNGQFQKANTVGKFCQSGSTQHNTDYYLWFSLGDTAQSETKVWSLGKGNTAATRTQVKMYKDKDRLVPYVRE